MNDENHCRDCCCAKSWEALGIEHYDGKSIPEHIEALRARVTELESQRAAIIENAVTLATFRMPMQPSKEWQESFRSALESLNP